MDIRDVARLSGYSLGTVSRAINGKPGVSAKARERVLEVVQECGYTPNVHAQGLKAERSQPIGIVVKGAQNQLFVEVVEHLQARLGAVGEAVQLVYLDESANEIAEAEAYLGTFAFKGIIFLAADLENVRQGLSSIKVPCVLLTNSAAGLGFANLSSFTVDDRAAAYEAVMQLVDAGHTRIGVLGGDGRDGQVATMRLAGATEALASHGIEFLRARDYVECRYSMQDGYTAMLELLAKRPRVTGVFCMADVIAIGALRALLDQGRMVPENISLVGFDGVELARYVTPRLTTIRQDTVALAQRGADALLERLANPELDPVHQTVPHKLYRGTSVAEPPFDFYDQGA